MRNKIDYGIDLGTTNSAIARMENGIPTIKKSDTLKDTIPSCVHFNRRQDCLVGDPAFNVLKNDNARALMTFKKGKTNTFIEFKRTMGNTQLYECTNMAEEYSSVELSAEVLKKLKSFIQDENITSLVITVPAKFLNPQNEATMKAAKIIGIKHVELLQEPVAAATAYGLESKNKDGFWMVFDFGGGTFDVALIKAEDGILTIKDTDGDNWLGGKNLDEAIVDQILLPNMQQNYAIDFVMDDPEKKELLRAAIKHHAEPAKNQLSFKDKVHILSALGDFPFKDENGDEPEIDIEVTQKDIEVTLSPIFQKAIDISLDLLKRNNLNGSNLANLILVGGPTLSPILRRMLKEQVSENIDTSVDPMTVVAKGAALFASTISVSDEVKDEVRDTTKVQLDIKYESTTVELDTIVNLKILKEKTQGAIPENVYVELTRFDGGWSSGKKKISTEKVTLLDEILLLPDRSNSFVIKLYDEEGNIVECQPNEFNVLQGVDGLDRMQVLPYHIGIGRYFSAEEKDLFMPVKGLEKNKPIKSGIVGVINGLKTRREIRPGMSSDKIRIPIFQGDYNAEGTIPILNNLVNEVIITGETLPGLLPVGSDVDITIKVDSSQIMKFSAYFVLLDHTETLDVDIKDTKPPEFEDISKEISNAKRAAKKVEADDIVKDIELLESQLENDKGSPDGKMKILDSLRKELLKLDNAEKKAEWPEVKKNLEESFYKLEELIEKINNNNDEDKINVDKVSLYIDEYRKKIEQVIKQKNIQEAKKLIIEIGQLDFDIRNAVSGNAMDAQYLQYLNTNFSKLRWKDPTKARQLINQGMQLLADGRNDNLRPIIIQIIDLMHDDDKPKETLE